jgi:hypothetical protein
VSELPAAILARRYLYGITVSGTESRDEVLELIADAWQAGFAVGASRSSGDPGGTAPERQREGPVLT